MVFTTKIKWANEIDKIKERGATGENMVALANSYGVTRQRMKQVIDRYIPNWNDKYGYAVKRKNKADKHWSKWGNKTDSELYQQQRAKFRAKKANSTRIGHEFTLQFGELDWPTHCPILGMELDYFLTIKSENSPTFDRIDSTKGYVPGNVHIISCRANRIKNDATVEELYKIAHYLDKLRAE